MYVPTLIYDTTVQIMYLEYSLCPKCTVYVPTVQFIIPALKFISLEYSLCPHIKVYDTTVQIMS